MVQPSGAGISYLGTVGIQRQPTAGSALTLTLPSPGGGILADDFLVALVTNNTNTVWATTALNAAGFTRRNTQQSGTGTQSPTGAVFYKKAVGGESGNISATNPGGVAAGIVLAYRGVDTTTPFDNTDAKAPIAGVTNYDVPAQTATMDGVAQVISAWANSNASSFNPPTNPDTFTELVDDSTAFPHFWVGHLLGRPSGSTGVRNLVRNAAIRGGVLGVLLRPAA